MKAVSSTGCSPADQVNGSAARLLARALVIRLNRPAMLVLVVGPSGVGKDTLMNRARVLLAGRSDIVFVKREITRPTTGDAEQHIPIEEDAFTRRQADGAYALSWRANGLGYGVRTEIESHLAAGAIVVLNTSREIVASARQRFGRVRIISIVADPATIAERLKQRGRESAPDMARRLERASRPDLSGDDVVVLRNEGGVEEGAQRLAELIAAE